MVRGRTAKLLQHLVVAGDAFVGHCGRRAKGANLVVAKTEEAISLTKWVEESNNGGEVFEDDQCESLLLGLGTGVSNGEP